MLKRKSKKNIENLLSKNKNWKVLDLGCGYSANKYATTIADKQNLTEFYKEKNFVEIKEDTLPFKDKEFDFIITSHVIEHVKKIDKFFSEIQRIAKRGYIELPTKLNDNLVHENLKEHIWWFEFDDEIGELSITSKQQILEPFINVSTMKVFEKIFRQSLVLELFWENKIPYKIFEMEKINKNYKFYNLIKKYLSKKIRTVIKKN